MRQEIVGLGDYFAAVKKTSALSSVFHKTLIAT
jgi:hypothetical protein